VVDIVFHRVHRRPSAGLDWDTPRPIAWSRVLSKLIGLMGTLVLIGLAYAVLREYATRFYEPFWHLLLVWGPWLLLAAAPYIAWVDARQFEPRDGLWHMGRLLQGGHEPGASTAIAEHLRGWGIRAFFLPLMTVYVADESQQLFANAEALLREASFLRVYDTTWSLLFTIEVVFATLGYIVSLRVTDTHLRSADPTVLGWASALVCYQPFWGFAFATYLKYEAGPTWGPWLSGYPVLQVVWGSVILTLLVIYSWATVAFGCRFSNLTNRGIITNGPYRYTKHPAYIAKNLAWWLVSVPWLADGGTAEALRCVALMLLVNGIYALRACAICCAIPTMWPTPPISRATGYSAGATGWG
jgi:hypothetical protein